MRPLYFLVFAAGLTTLGMELSAARLLEPAFGNSQLVWAAIIGLILLSLAAGAWLGGWLADRCPQRAALELTLTLGAAGVALIPLLSTPVLRLAAVGLAGFAVELLFSALLAVGALFALPAVLLGTATPWALRLAASEPASLGRTAGRLSATATAGSLLGAFLPVLWLIPAFGTRWSFYLLALLLLAVTAVSGWRGPYRWYAPAAGLAVLCLALFTQPTGIRATWEDGRSGVLLYEDESALNYIAVHQWGSERHLKLNEGVGIHSVYHPESLLSQGIWDYFLLAPFFRQQPLTDLLLIGAAAGTVPGLYTRLYGPVPITGIELDPAILAVGVEFFGASWPNYRAIAGDGRRWLASLPAATHYDVIAVDAYRPPYSPFHLTTVEFFTLAREHLAPDGVVVVNVGRTDTDATLVDAIAATLQQVFPTVFVVDEPGPPATLANSLVVATRLPTSLAPAQARAAALPAALPAEWRAFARRALAQARPARPPSDTPIFTDDRSQVEEVVHRLIFNFLVGSPPPQRPTSPLPSPQSP